MIVYRKLYKIAIDWENNYTNYPLFLSLCNANSWIYDYRFYITYQAVVNGDNAVLYMPSDVSRVNSRRGGEHRWSRAEYPSAFPLDDAVVHEITLDID